MSAKRCPAGGREQGRAPELLGDDDGDEVRLAARQAPHLLEQRLHPTLLDLEHLEPRLLLGEVPPARTDAGIGVAAWCEERADRLAARDGAARTRALPRSRRRSRSTQSSTWFFGSPGEADRVDTRSGADARTGGSGG